MRSLPQTTAAPPPRQEPSAASGTWPGRDLLTTPETAHVLHAAWSGDPAVIVPSPPGAGKTRLVTLLAAGLAHRAEMRIGIAAQTRAQTLEIASRVGALSDRARLMWSRKGPRPALDTVPIISGHQAPFPQDRGGILIATMARWLLATPDQLACDLLVVDEAYQATYADLGALGAFAAQVVCVGDPGQIDPVVTGVTKRWVASPTGPHLPAPQALRAAHGDAVAVVPLRSTWRLGPETTALIQPTLYPNLPFTSRRPPEHISNPVDGPLPELAHRVVDCTAGPADPALITATATRVRELLTCGTLTRESDTRPVTPEDIAVVTPHVNQAAALQAALSDTPDVLIGTANQLQGMERAAVVVLHPLAGYREVTEFAADPGRTCVMLSRHRSHATVICDAHTAAALAATTDSPAIATHRSILAALLDTPHV